MAEHTDCPFCKIAQKHYHVHEVYRDDKIMAFLDNHPIRLGHVQIIPLEHYPYFDDLPPVIAAQIMHLGQRLAKIQKQIYSVGRVAFLCTGGDIPHAHAHLVPMHEKTDITSRLYIAEKDLTFRSTPQANNEDLSRTAKELVDALTCTTSETT